MEHYFKNQKSEIMKLTVLSHPDDANKYIVSTDAYGYGLDAWIWKVKNNALNIILFASGFLSYCGRNNPQRKLELLAIVYKIRKFRPYLIAHCSRVMWVIHHINRLQWAEYLRVAAMSHVSTRGCNEPSFYVPEYSSSSCVTQFQYRQIVTLIWSSIGLYKPEGNH